MDQSAIDIANEKLRSTIKKHPKLFPEGSPGLGSLGSPGSPGAVVYEGIFYPIVYETLGFFYLAGKQVRMVMKAKCIYKSTGKSDYWLATASDQDIELGRSPIFPIECKKSIYLHKDLIALEIKLKGISTA